MDYHYTKNKIVDLIRDPYPPALDSDFLFLILDQWPQENYNCREKAIATARMVHRMTSHDQAVTVFRPPGIGREEEWATLSTGRIRPLDEAIDALRKTEWWRRCHRQSWPLTGMHLFAV